MATPGSTTTTTTTTTTSSSSSVRAMDIEGEGGGGGGSSQRRKEKGKKKLFEGVPESRSVLLLEFTDGLELEEHPGYVLTGLGRGEQPRLYWDDGRGYEYLGEWSIRPGHGILYNAAESQGDTPGWLANDQGLVLVFSPHVPV